LSHWHESGDRRESDVRPAKERALGSTRALRLAVGCLVLTLSLGALWGCGGASQRPVRYGTYVSQLCEAIGPFEADAQTFGKTLGKYGLALKSRKSRQKMASILGAVVSDSRGAATRLNALGAPKVENGHELASAMIDTFEQIAQSDAVWRYELMGPWVWPDPSASRAKRARLRTALGALLRVGREFERLPSSQERQDAMARSPVCREVFGSVRYGSAS
jgi:hypothetical protein